MPGNEKNGPPNGLSPDDMNSEDSPKRSFDSSEPVDSSRKIADLESALAQLKDQLLRKAAEFENYKKRSENENLSYVRFANENLITRLIPVLDDFERLMKSLQSGGGEGTGENSRAANEAADAYRKGFELIYNKFLKILEANGVKHFEVVGQPFDPQLHDALMMVPRQDVPPHTVLEEIEKGYTMNDKVIRHARVIVSEEPALEEKKTD
jgi:molecular chaperone GrpE